MWLVPVVLLICPSTINNDLLVISFHCMVLTITTPLRVYKEHYKYYVMSMFIYTGTNGV